MLSTVDLKTSRALEEMVMRVVARELATTSEMPSVELGEFDLAYRRWQEKNFVDVTQEMPCWVEEDLVYAMVSSC